MDGVPRPSLLRACHPNDKISRNKALIFGPQGFRLHFGQMLFEVPHILRLSHTNLDKYVFFENEENFIKAIEKEKGTFILTAHFGNWELMSVVLALNFAVNKPGAVVVRPIDFLAADLLIRDLRSRFGTKIIPKQHGIRSILRAIKENKIVGYY